MLNRPWLLVLTAALAACSRPATEPAAEPLPATVAAAAETAPTAQDGANGVAIWVHPEDGAKSLVLGAGGTLDDIVKTTVYLTEGTDREKFAEAYRKFFAAHGYSGNMPAGLTVVVEELSPRCLVEIDSVAYLGSR